MVHTRTYTHNSTNAHTCGYAQAKSCADGRLRFQAFELATGDYLFEPHSGEDYTRDEGQSQQRPPVTHTVA